MDATPKPSAPARPGCLVLMFKAPARSKRRLADEIGPDAAAAAELLLACALEDAAAWPGPVCYAPAAASDTEWLRLRIGDPELIVQQTGGNLGERLNDVNAELLARGIERQLFIGIDCPALTPDDLERADRALDNHDLVLAPAQDGGAVLIGTRRKWPALGGLPWSQPDLLDALRRRCRDEGWSVGLTEPRRDVDSLADLEALADTLARDARPARRSLLGWLQQYPTASAGR